MNNYIDEDIESGDFIEDDDIYEEYDDLFGPPASWQEYIDEDDEYWEPGYRQEDLPDDDVEEVY